MKNARRPSSQARAAARRAFFITLLKRDAQTDRDVLTLLSRRVKLGGQF